MRCLERTTSRPAGAKSQAANAAAIWKRAVARHACINATVEKSHWH